MSFDVIAQGTEESEKERRTERELSKQTAHTAFYYPLLDLFASSFFFSFFFLSLGRASGASLTDRDELGTEVEVGQSKGEGRICLFARPCLSSPLFIVYLLNEEGGTLQA